MVERLRAGLPANSISPPGTQVGGNKNIQYGFGRFELDPDQALVVELRARRAALERSMAHRPLVRERRPRQPVHERERAARTSGPTASCAPWSARPIRARQRLDVGGYPTGC
jgi:hypothetical protein